MIPRRISKLALVMFGVLFVTLTAGEVIAADGRIGSVSTGTASISFVIEPQLVPLSSSLVQASSVFAGEAGLEVAFASNVEAVDYEIKPSISGSNTDLGVFALEATGSGTSSATIAGIVDDLVAQDRVSDSLGEAVTLVLIAQPKQ